MKSVVVRSLGSMVVGGLLVAFPSQMTVWLVMLIGFLFFIPGIYSIVVYGLMYRKAVESRPLFPVVGVGSALLGLWMILEPSFFIVMSVTALGILLIIAALNLIFRNIRSRKMVQIPLAFYLLPILLVLAGGYVLLNPIESASLPFYVLGVAMFIYGGVELWHVLWIRSRMKKVSGLENVEIVEAEIVE